MPMSVRLDAKTERLIEGLARKRGQTKSEIIREAIGAVAEEQTNGSDSAKQPYKAVKDLIGCVRGGPPDLSVGTGKRFRQLLVRKNPR
jgi:predicted DNA-binding protein